MTAARKGQVYLVGAGPGDPELLTLRALRLIESADTILHDDLVPPAILALAPTSTLLLSVGKRCGVKKITQAEINRMMIQSARDGMSVVRLKSSDPLIFGRAAEEIDALRSASIPFHVVPGVTSAFAAAAALGISLTDRRAASGVHFATAHHAAGAEAAQYTPESFTATQVVYMPGRSLAAIAAQWLAANAPPDLPCAIISRAAQPDQSIQPTTLKHLAGLRPLGDPTILLAGWALAALPAADIEIAAHLPIPREQPATHEPEHR